MKRWFTPEEVDALIPRLEELMTQLQRMKGDLLAANAALQAAKQRRPRQRRTPFLPRRPNWNF
ncbi:MAG: DUF2203 family protein [Alicyclobacillaceae bacterium]|nr:DUF2203 family protein [Alicyclobacillaceae bacterium]